ncbi:hypothetical protein ACVIGA_003690 [Bradyrhizobium sp. USDA 3240]
MLASPVGFFAKTGKDIRLISDDDATLPPGPAWQAARKACQTPIDRERLAAATKARWRPEEFSEYARSCHRRRGRDYATSHSYRSALKYHGKEDAKLWRKLFRERGSLRLPPRCPKELDYTAPASGIGSNHRYWPFHSPELIALIDARARAYFKIRDTFSVHPHAWIASYLWHQREQAEDIKA